MKKNQNQTTTIEETPAALENESVESNEADTIARALANVEKGISSLSVIVENNRKEAEAGNKDGVINVGIPISKLRKLLLDLPAEHPDVIAMKERFEKIFPVNVASQKLGSTDTQFVLAVPQDLEKDIKDFFEPTLAWQLGLLEKELITPQNVIAAALATLENLDGPKAILVTYRAKNKTVPYGKLAHLDTRGNITDEMNGWEKDGKKFANIIIDCVKAQFPDGVSEKKIAKYPCFVVDGKPMTAKEVRGKIMETYVTNMNVADDEEQDNNLFGFVDLEEKYVAPKNETTVSTEVAPVTKRAVVEI